MSFVAHSKVAIVTICHKPILLNYPSATYALKGKIANWKLEKFKYHTIEFDKLLACLVF